MPKGIPSSMLCLVITQEEENMVGVGGALVVWPQEP